MTRPLNFTSEQERRDWMIEHADKFVIIRRANRRNYRVEFPTLELAQRSAAGIVARYPFARLLIYAVCGVSDVWVENVIGEGNKNAEAASRDSSLRRNHI